MAGFCPLLTFHSISPTINSISTKHSFSFTELISCGLFMGRYALLNNAYVIASIKELFPAAFFPIMHVL